MSEKIPAEIPREWLPDPVARAGGDDAEVWDERLRVLMIAARPRLARLRSPDPPTWEVLASWWRWVTGLSVATSAALAAFLILAPAVPGTTPSAALALNAVVGEGNPAALWAGLGVEADPVLALVVLEGGTP